jgi:hypothetical protein
MCPLTRDMAQGQRITGHALLGTHKPVARRVVLASNRRKFHSIALQTSTLITRARCPGATHVPACRCTQTFRTLP